MSAIAEAVRHMMKAGMDADAIADAVAAMEEASVDLDLRTARQKRNSRYYQRKSSEKRLNASYSDVSDADLPSPKKETSPTPPKEKTTPSQSPVVGARAQFEDFWALFPNKVGKRRAESEFIQALQRASFEEIMDGLRRYVAKTDDRPWCNPTTFLHQDRWNDQPALLVQHRATAPPPKKVTLASMWRDEGRKLGILDDPSTENRRMETGYASGENPSLSVVGITSISRSR